MVRGLRPAGAAPEPRAYHAFARLGACCCCVAGRSHGNKLVKGKQLVVVWDAAANRWLTPGGRVRTMCGGGAGLLRRAAGLGGTRPALQLGGGAPCRSAPLAGLLSCQAAAKVPGPPCRHRPTPAVPPPPTPRCPCAPAPGAGVVGGELAPRSSHRAASVPGGILLFGGAVDRGVKAADLQLLAAGAHGRLSWRQCPPGGEQPGGGGGGGWPAGRGAHVVEVVGGRLYVLGGYGEVRAAGGGGGAGWLGGWHAVGSTRCARCPGVPGERTQRSVGTLLVRRPGLCLCVTLMHRAPWH